MRSRRTSCLALALGGLLAQPMTAAVANDAEEPIQIAAIDREVIIVGGRQEAYAIPGSAHFIGPEDLLKFNYADVQQILREVPGVSIQSEDGYGLRPNISIRGVATERSGRITLMEDGVLIAPAPYSAPSAYYFPTAGRMHAFEVLKGPAAITQGPYTIGGALNMVSTPIPDEASMRATMEGGGDSTYRLHAHAGGTKNGVGLLLETHQWGSDGFQSIDRVGTKTGLELQDHMAKLSYAPADSRHAFEVKFQYADQQSDQSYMGLTDADFHADPHRRYGLSSLDNISTTHHQYILRYKFQISDALSLSATAYENDHERNWFKTEGLDLDGTDDADAFKKTNWYNVVQAVNKGQALGKTTGETDDDCMNRTGCYTAAQLQGILDGTRDTEDGGIQLKTNAREYFSRGVQLKLNWNAGMGALSHDLEVGLRYHEDEEDRIQRIDAYTQKDGRLVLHDLGTLGHRAAGNRVQEAEAVALHVRDEITYGDWVFTPGFRYEDIDQKRTRYDTKDGQLRVFRSTRKNDTEVFLPGLGILYRATPSVSLLAGAHKGFTAPSNSPGVNEEEAWNYELGLRYASDSVRGELIGFYSDYENILGECTASSGTDCTVGDAFNGDAATVQGVEAMLTANLEAGSTLDIPVSLAYTYIDSEFDTDIADTDFFGDVRKGDPIPYIPEHQMKVAIGLESPQWAVNLSGSYVDEVCVRASCGAFERTDSLFVTDLSGSYKVSANVTLIARVENLFDAEDIAGRHPYGARPNKARTGMLGIRFDNVF